jgi:hypothetical protein
MGGLLAALLLGGATARACDEHGWEWVRPGGSNAPPNNRGFGYVVWTGEEMLLSNEYYGEYPNSVSLSSGRAYNPSRNSWRTTPSYQPLGRRGLPSVVWTGKEMIVWGGNDYSKEGPERYDDLNTGAAFDPKTNTWRSISTVNAPGPRAWHVGLWTPVGMFIWGGTFDNEFINTGGIYDPGSDTWTRMGIIGAPVGRWDPVAVFVDGQLLLWGGHYFEVPEVFKIRLVLPPDVSRYNPDTGTWLSIRGINTPQLHKDARWGESYGYLINDKLYVWGYASFPVSEGFIYDKSTNLWSRTPSTILLEDTEPAEPSVVWTGYQFLMWDMNGWCAHYNPETKAWKTGASSGRPSLSEDDLGGRHKFLHQYVWTGEELLTHQSREGLFSYRPKCLNTDRMRIIGSCNLHPGHWLESSWLGWFNDLHFPWIYHTEHKWMYAAETGGDWTSLWDIGMGWLLTHRDSYPVVYQSSSGHWLFYSPGTHSPRWFYDYSTGLWITG